MNKEKTEIKSGEKVLTAHTSQTIETEEKTSRRSCKISKKKIVIFITFMLATARKPRNLNLLM